MRNYRLMEVLVLMMKTFCRWIVELVAQIYTHIYAQVVISEGFNEFQMIFIYKHKCPHMHTHGYSATVIIL